MANPDTLATLGTQDKCRTNTTQQNRGPTQTPPKTGDESWACARK
jgi:hypothetical protein